MKKFNPYTCLLLIAAFLLGACSEKQESFYATIYPVERVEFDIQVDETPQEENTEGDENGDGSEEGDNSGETTGGETGENETSGDGDGTEEGGEEPEPEEGPIAKLIREEMTAVAPVQAGGSYLLSFDDFDGGPLTVYPTAGATPLAGEFTKVPGEKTITFRFGEEEYSVAMTRHNESGYRATLFTVDYTEAYQSRFPDVRVLSARRLEYTSHKE